MGIAWKGLYEARSWKTPPWTLLRLLLEDRSFDSKFIDVDYSPAVLPSVFESLQEGLPFVRS